MEDYNNRNWIKETLAHQDGLDVPYNFMFSPLILQGLQSHFGQDDVEQAVNLPIRMSEPASIKPLYADPDKYGPTIKDEFGVVWSTNHIDRGSPIGPALPEPDLAKYKSPDPATDYRFDGLDDWCSRNSENYTVLWAGDLWERATFMRGMENILLDLAVNPEFVEQLLRGLTDHILRTMEILFDRCVFDCIAVSDDYGMQKSLVMSPQSWRQFIKPRLTEIYSLAHKHGRTVFHHSCGNNYPIIPDLIEIGLDILHPIQPETMDILQLKREFGRDLTFCGGLPTQDLLPNGRPQQIRDEVIRLKNQMGRGGGYILETGITIQADVPLENVLALIDQAQQPN